MSKSQKPNALELALQRARDPELRRLEREQRERDQEQRRLVREQQRAKREREKEQRRIEREDKREREEQRRLHDELRPPSPHAGVIELATIEIGASAEERAVARLEANGYEIVERNYRCDAGELDIIAREGGDLVFVEVRSRSTTDYGDASLAVGPHKRRKVGMLAEIYLRHKRPWFETCRFDVVAISGEEVEVYKDAWRGGLLF